MRAMILAVLLLAAAAPAAARADGFLPPEWFQRAEALVHSLSAMVLPPDRDVIAAPADMDRQMVLAPPSPHGVLRIIAPASPPRQH